MEYYGSCLNPIEREFYLKLIDTIKRRFLFVKADKITDEKSFLKCISAVQYDYPELFYMDYHNCRYVAFQDGWEFRPQYLYNVNETEKKRKEFEQIADRIILEMKKRGLSSIYQKCGYIHSYLVRNCTYDYEALKDEKKRRVAYTMEGPLLEKTGVCQGIALAYRYICVRCGIDAIAVKGVSLRPGTTTYEGHAWNLIRVGDKAAQIDTTWDMCLTSKDWPIRYDYFFLPDIEMMRDHQYVGYPICRKMQMSYYERNQSQFKELKEIDGFIEKIIFSDKKKDEPGEHYFQFKMVNRRETEEEVQNYVRDAIRKFTNRGYSYTVSINGTQSVFSYKVEIK